MSKNNFYKHKKGKPGSKGLNDYGNNYKARVGSKGASNNMPSPVSSPKFGAFTKPTGAMGGNLYKSPYQGGGLGGKNMN